MKDSRCVAQSKGITLNWYSPKWVPKNVHANSLQRVSRNHGLHWRTVDFGWHLPPCALCARAAKCVHVTTLPGPVKLAPDSCQPPGNYGPCAIGIADRKYMNGTRARTILS
ncbi:hypothetical protein T03_17080 [Trichinella britovi]|uniref:Uncharacterized protein n=1 Tax=Trichinella britovi TaxID=45882 RepID=A0A0V1C8E7_TRIBR|nr:hypothetical protein T03_17080 [Trichinella britovi]